MATEGRSYRVFYEARASHPMSCRWRGELPLLARWRGALSMLEVTSHRFVPFILSFENKLDHLPHGASSASALGDDV